MARPSHRSTSSSHRGALTTAFRVAWPFAVAGGMLWATGRYGLSPTDDEPVLAGSWRILNSQIPHRDVVSARPIGSSILHLLDLALPGPLFLDGRFTTALEFLLIAGALLALALRGAGMRRSRSVGRTACLASGTTAVAALNLQTFPLTPWYTVDGLACTAVGWFLVDDGLRAGSAGRQRLGLLLTGFAAICKQSFALAPVIALGMIVAGRRSRGIQRSACTLVIDALALLAAPIGYLTWLAMAGGLGDVVRELSSGPVVWGRPIILGLWHPALTNPSAVATCAMFVAAVCGWVLCRTRSGSSTLLYTVSVAEITIAVVGTMLGTTLAEPTGSGIAPFAGRSLEPSALVWWMCVALTVADALIERRVFFPALATCALAWMASLSWRYPLPALLQGSVTACAVILTWRPHPGTKNFWTAIPWPKLMRRVALTAALFTATVACVAIDLTERATHEYRDGQRAALSANLVTAAAAGRSR